MTPITLTGKVIGIREGMLNDGLEVQFSVDRIPGMVDSGYFSIHFAKGAFDDTETTPTPPMFKEPVSITFESTNK